MGTERVLGVIEWSDGLRGAVERNPCVVGRNGDVKIRNDWVSKEHLRLVWARDGFRLVDLGSTNGTMVGGQRAVAGVEVPVRWNEEVQLGESGPSFRLLRPEAESAENENREPSEAKTEPDQTKPKVKVVEIDEWFEATIARASETLPGRRRGRRPGLALSERDIEVLEWIAAHRWSTREILLGALYSNPDPSKMQPGRKPSGKYGNERLAKLERAGFIHPSFIRIGKTVPLLLTPKGYDVLHGQGRAMWAHPFPDIDAARFAHELLVQRLRIHLEGFGAHAWQTERRLAQLNRQQKLAYVPDSNFEASGRRFALEVERTLKAKKRLHEFLKIRAKWNTHTKMLYVIPERLMEPFTKAISDSYSRFAPGLYILTEEDFQSGKKNLLVRCLNSNWATMPLSELMAGKLEQCEIEALERERLAKARADFQARIEAQKPLVREIFAELEKRFGACRAAILEREQKHAVVKVAAKLLDKQTPVPKPTKPERWQELVNFLNEVTALGKKDANLSEISKSTVCAVGYMGEAEKILNAWEKAADGHLGPTPPEKLGWAKELREWLK